ncbi:hypothetical protein ABTE74_23545, partial [Acinetobacter baumannii]
EPMQRTVLHSLARAAIGLTLACGAALSNGALADTVFKEPGGELSVEAQRQSEPRKGLLSSMMNSTSHVANKAGDLV